MGGGGEAGKEVNGEEKELGGGGSAGKVLALQA